jgi:hypothetical protein
MKTRLLLLLLMLTGSFVNANDTIRTLIITEARLDHHQSNFVEITNVGDFPIQLSDFKFGLIRPWNNIPWTPENPNRAYRLPEKILHPGQSYVMATVWEFNPKQFKKGVLGYQERVTKQEIWELADFLIHVPEAIYGETGDSVSGDFWWTWETQNGRGCFFLEQHLSENDSVVVDQVGGVFDQENGLNRSSGFYDVAGVYGATGNSILVRKNKIKTGNLDFANARGVGEDDSEWIAVPIRGGAWRDVFWTLGNHGSNVLDQNTLESDIIEVDYSGKKLIVPWGIRRLDDIMRHMKKKPGIAWEYHFSEDHNDSLHISARTGDKLTIFVCGDELYKATFDIVLKNAAANANIVIPKFNKDPLGAWRNIVQAGEIAWPRVSRNESGIDSITGALFGLPFATRTDSLLKLLEKAPNAKWEFIWVDGIERPDLKNGDKLKVTAENGSVKEYYIQVQDYRASINANLSSITWPDIPDFYRDAFGWVGDTIPGFSPGSYNYKVDIPADVSGIPAFVAKTQALNAKVEVKRATSLSGDIDQRMLKFTVTAEDDTTFRFYNVELSKQKDPEKLQPYFAEPFLSQFVFWVGWTGTNFFEICNPGNQILDLSNYMIVGGPIYDPGAAITITSGEDDWLHRYRRYVPGYKWVSQADWAANPSRLERDLNVNPLIMPGNVFVMATITTNVGDARNRVDIDFSSNPWGEPVGATLASNWTDQNWFLFKILNDSIKLGLKAANDIRDFELIETFGTGDGSTPYGWINFNASLIRRPDFTIPKSGFKESFGTGWWHNSEWYYQDNTYWANQGVYSHLAGLWDIGKHYFYEPTHYKSTINSLVYKVSEGYSMSEEIRGLTINTSVDDFLSKLIKADQGQILKIKSSANGSELPLNAIINLNDTLIVLSADEKNITKYLLNVSERGLSSNAILTSEEYFISVEVTTGGIYNVPAGIKLSEVVANVTVPEGAVLTVVNGDDAWVPFTRINFDSTYVDVLVSQDIYFEVVAENGTTKILYQMVPMSDPQDAYVLSDVYTVDQDLGLIHFVPRGTEVSTFLRNLIPAPGATLKVVDKSGLQRTRGGLYQDDMLVVTSQDGQVTKVYYLDMLRTQFVVTNYLAFVLSDDYMVNQLNKVISSPVAETPLAQFYAKLTPAFGATMAVYNKDGQLNSTGILNKGDVLVVTSADGRTTATYALMLDVTSINQIESGLVSVYPNPTTGKVSISGVEAGSKVRVFNMMGAPVSEFISRSSIETISLENQASGIYFIVVSNNERINGTYKVIKK